VRQAAAGFALVTEERNRRVAEQRDLVEPIRRFEERVAEYERTLLPRVDIALLELWRRAEAADARNATAIQRLAEEVAALKAANEALRARLE
jgi:hypothetical protein